MAEQTVFNVSLLVKDIEKKETVRIEHCELFEASLCRQSIEKEYPYPDFDILEIVSEAKAFIYADTVPPESQKTTIKDRLKKEAKSTIEPKLGKLRHAVESNDQELIEKAGMDLLQKHSEDVVIKKEVAVAFASQPLLLAETDSILEDLIKSEPGNAEYYRLLGDAHFGSDSWHDAAKRYETAAELATEPNTKFGSLLRSAFAYWKNRQNEKAAKVCRVALKIAEESGDSANIKKAKNSLIYYWAELNKNLEQAKDWALENLEIDKEANYLVEIETKDLQTTDARGLDTLGRVLESMDLVEKAIQVTTKANNLQPNNPVIKDNLLRLIEKLSKKIR